MAALANMTLNDGLGTPVARTFNFVDHGNGVYLWRYNIVGSSIAGCPYYELRKVRDDAQSRKIRAKTVQPVLESVGSQNAQGYTAPPKVAFLNTISTDIVINKRSLSAQVDDVYAFHINGLLNAQVSEPAKIGLFGY